MPGLVAENVFLQALRETLRQQRLERLELPRRCIQFNTGTVGWLSFHFACGNLWKRNRMKRRNRLLMKLKVESWLVQGSGVASHSSAYS